MSEVELLRKLEVKDKGSDFVHLKWEPVTKKGYISYQLFAVKFNDPKFAYCTYNLEARTDCKCSSLEPNTEYCFVVQSTDLVNKVTENKFVIVKTEKTFFNKVAPVISGVGAYSLFAVAAVTTVVVTGGLGFGAVGCVAGGFAGGAAATAVGFAAGDAVDKILSPEDYAREFIRRLK